MSIRLVQIINQTKSEGAFTNLETSADDVIINANGSTNTPGQQGEGCNIPDCGAGKWWDSHRMTLTLEKATLSLWKEGRTVYYRSDQTVYPGCGNFLWQDNGLSVTLNISPECLPVMTNP
ncbi:hypothetical protein [Armatimonas sp.]|uniref:hypothetical protein n=1 Tax=Armatimonas sp. TaxID=1872638 RepID=UPI0037530553